MLHVLGRKKRKKKNDENEEKLQNLTAYLGYNYLHCVYLRDEKRKKIKKKILLLIFAAVSNPSNKLENIFSLHFRIYNMRQCKIFISLMEMRPS